MRISRRKYPVLNILKEGIFGKLPISEKDYPYLKQQGIDLFKLVLSKNLQKYRSNILVVSKPFLNASEKSASKLLTLYNEILEDSSVEMNFQGTIITGNVVHFYQVGFGKTENSCKETIMSFYKDGRPISLFINDESILDVLFGWVSKSLKKYSDSEANIEFFIKQMVQHVVIVNMFKKYAEVETKTVKGKRNAKLNNHKITNDFEQPITFLDSKWFTNIVRSEGFKVSGHFRLQPYKKDGIWTKKLIWIDEFQKEGYTSKAKILKQ